MRYLYSILLLLVFTSLTSAKEKYHETVYPTESKFIYDACLSVNGKVIICTDDNTLKAFSVKSKELLGNFTGGHRTKVLCVAMSPDSTMVASGGSDSTVVIWDFSTHAIIQRITFATGKITSIKFSPDNQFILFGCSNSPAYLYNIKEQKKVHDFTDQQLDITSVAFSYDGSLIAIAGADKIIRLYNTADFQLKSELKGHTNWVRSISFYNHDQNLISCGDDKKIIQWDLLKYDNTKINAHNNWILSVDIVNNDIQGNNMYVFGTMNGSIRINYSFGFYKAKLNSTITKVLILPNKTGVIEIAVATLGSGLMNLSAANMPISK
jgi:WD40 repeat protein